MIVLQLGTTGGFLLFVVLPAVALAVAIALSVYEVYRIGERKLLILLVILALMLQHQLLEAYSFVQAGEGAEGVGEIFETGANLIASGSVYYVLRFARRERRLVTELEQSEQQYRNLIEEAPVPTLLHGRDEIQYANDAAVEMFEADSRDQVTGSSLGAFLPTEASQDVRETVLADGGTETVESQLETLDDGTRQVILTGAPANYEGQNATQVVVQDLTERKRRERELREERDRRSTLFERNPDPVVEVEFERGQPTIREVNATFQEVFGFDAESIGGQTVAEAIVPESERDDYERLLERTLQGKTVETEVQRETEDGVREFILRIMPFQIDNAKQAAYVWYTDVTERRELERTYRTVFENVSDGLVIHDPETGEMLDVNGRFCEMNGYDREQLVGESVAMISGPDHEYDAAQDRIQQAREKGRQLFEWRNQRSDGTTFPVEVHLSVVSIRGEERVLASVRDISERKRREREYEQIFNGVHDCITIHDLETARVLEVNDAFCDLLGYSRDEIIEMGIDGYSAGDSEYTRERAQEIVDEVVETGEPKQTEWAVETRDGETRWLEIKGTTVEIGGELRFVSIDRDVTERRRREREYEQIFNGVNDAIVIHDPETMEMVEVNDTFCDLLGYDRETILELGTGGISVKDEGYTQERAEEVISAVMEEGERGPFEWKVETKDGDHRLLEVRATTAEIGGELRHVSINRDVTERKRREREFEQIYNGVQDGLQIMDPDTLEILDVNDAYLEMFGYDSLDAIREEGVEGLSATEDGFTFEEGREIHQRVVETGEPEIHVWKAMTTDDEPIWLELKIMPAMIGGEQRTIVVHRDITERKERERTLESFHDATAELTTADTVREAGRIAVEAAADVFDLPATAVYHYDEETGQLDPSAAGPALPSTDELPSLTAEDDAAWSVFVEERMNRMDIDSASTLDSGPSEEALLLPLGGNGVLVVWQTGESADTDAASILAATLEAALNRLRGERQLESRREELEAHAERARRLESITELTQRVEAAITTESSRQGIQKAVCEELVDVEPFTAAWIAEAEVGTDRLTPHTVAGIDRDEAELVVTGDSGGTDPHPGTEVWETGEPSVGNDLVAGGRRSDWRRTLLRRGAGSLCAVPLAHSDVTHGVLTVVAEEPDAFGDREVAVLSQLGESIGYAITAIERQRALESDDTLELEFEGTDVELPFARLTYQLDCRVRHERTVRRQDGSVSVYYTLVGDLPETIAKHASEVFSGEVNVVSRQDQKAILERRGSSWFGSFISEYGGVLRQGQATDSGVTLVVEIPNEADTRTMVDRIEDELEGVELIAQRHHRETDVTSREVTEQLKQRLSDRQYEALETAHAMGYFEWPRESSGEDVAETLDITQPTVNKHIRLGEHKVFDLLFESAQE